MKILNPLNKRFIIIDRSCGQLRLYDYRFYIHKPWAKYRALLCLLPEPVLEDLQGKKIIRFSNSGFGLAWARILNELGYVLDIISWDDSDFIPKHNYDLVVFHGAKTFPNVYQNLNKKPKIIHFLSGSYWKFNNSQEDQRIKAFENRHKTKLPRDRYITIPEEPVNEVSEGIVVLGNHSVAKTYPSNMRVLTINNASYPDSHFDSVEKDYEKARKNFLYFAGGGNIHKGLDLTIEAFAELVDEHLYIVTVPEKKFLSVYKKELKRPNIHLVGEVTMRNEQFYEVMDKCAYVILPSCSEGQAGSVVEAMNQGLIPIVSKETHLDVDDFGRILTRNSISTIRKTVQNMSNLSPSKVGKMANKSRGAAIAKHNPYAFRKKLKAHIKYLLADTNQM